MKIIVSEKLLRSSDDDGIAAFVDFVAVMRELNMPDFAFAPDLLTVVDLDAWLREVEDIGLGQFVANSGKNSARRLTGILALLRSSGAKAHALIIERAISRVLFKTSDSTRQPEPVNDAVARSTDFDNEHWAAAAAEPVRAIVTKWLVARPDLMILPDGEVETARVAEANRIKHEQPEVRRAIVAEIADTCRKWLSDPVNVGLALASGRLTEGMMHVASVPKRDTNGARSISVVIYRKAGADALRDPGQAIFDAEGVRVYHGDGTLDAKPHVFVARREIERATKMALAFRLPEAVALNWLQISGAFSIDVHNLQVMPGGRWLPHKWRILWVMSPEWAVKGSPKQLIFADLETRQTETLTQDEIASRIKALGLKTGG